MEFTTNLDVATTCAGSPGPALPCLKPRHGRGVQALRRHASVSGPQPDLPFGCDGSRRRASRSQAAPILAAESSTLRCRTVQCPTARSVPTPDPTSTLALWITCVEQGLGEQSEQSWFLLVRRLEPYLKTVLRHRLGALGITMREEIDESLQDVYCRLFEKEGAAMRRCRATSDGEVLAYLKRICSTVVLDRERSRRAQKRSALLTDLVDDIASPSSSVYEELRTRELRNLLLEECRRVSTAAAAPRDVWIFERAVLDGWSTEEIADWVDLRPPSVDAIVCRMRQKLAVRGLTVPSRTACASAASSRPSAGSMRVQR